MQVDFKSGFGKINFSKMQLIPALGFFWQKTHKFIFAIFLIGLIVLGWYIWSNSLSGGEWSSERKQEYLDAQNKSVVFKEDAFRNALADIEMRKQNKAVGKKEIKDIFKAY